MHRVYSNYTPYQKRLGIISLRYIFGYQVCMLSKRFGLRQAAASHTLDICLLYVYSSFFGIILWTKGDYFKNAMTICVVSYSNV